MKFYTETELKNNAFGILSSLADAGEAAELVLGQKKYEFKQKKVSINEFAPLKNAINGDPQELVDFKSYNFSDSDLND